MDPRFDRAFGHFNEDLFSKSYEFIGDLQKEERQNLQASLRSEKNPGRKFAMKQTLERLNSMQKSKERKEQRQKLVREHRKLDSKLVEHGKTPYFLKRGDIKNLELVEEFERVKKRLGKDADIDKFIEKKRKRKASKQKKFMPNREE
jgi:ribosomal RNA-processing protein 36